jgi:hypothetical protein
MNAGRTHRQILVARAAGVEMVTTAVLAAGDLVSSTLLLDHPIMEYVVQKSERDRRLLFMTH